MVTIEEGEGDLVAKPAIDPKVFETLNPNRFDHIFLHREGADNYRYRLTVVDRPISLADTLQHVTAVVLVPAGRESEFLFGTQRGLLSVAQSAACARLIAVAFGRHQEFDSQGAVQDELTFGVQVLSQQGHFLSPAIYKRNSKIAASIPFMALDGIGTRNVVAQGETTLSGQYLVEQVKVENDQWLRRLYFMENPFVIQSEVALLDEKVVDKTHLAFDYHKHMCAGIMALALTTEEASSSGLVVGLGGGGLVNFLQHILQNNSLAVVELDDSVVTVAEQYFGFEQGDHTKTTVHIGDGLTIQPEGAAGAGMPVGAPLSLNFIGIDVDSKDKTVGMSCPPQAFVEVDYITTLKSLLRTDGLLVINVSARDPEMLEMVMRNVKSVFETVFVSGQDDDEEDKQDVNLVVLATASKMELPPRLELMKRLKGIVESSASINSTGGSDSSTTKLQETISDLEDSLAGLAIRESCKPKAAKNKKGGGTSKKKRGKRK